MRFFDALRRSLGQESGVPGPATPEHGQRWLDAASPPNASQYDQAQWRKKLALILETLPESQSRWDELMAEARAMSFDSDWILRVQIEEFFLLIRRAVSDRRFTEDEHEKLELARRLIGMTEAEAEGALQTVVAEAEQFFGKPVRDV